MKDLLDLRAPETSWRSQLRKLGYHYDGEGNNNGIKVRGYVIETWKKDIDTAEGPKTISTCIVSSLYNPVVANEPTFVFMNCMDGQRVTVNLDELMKVDGIRL
ncbi:hypothetical protein [Bifidobacterium moukalabense]|uniref:hypothetical protein n=1 Tax=Bifidobacterium moukalabense TaxID=1333651 RepID=UPI0010F85B34|nr:hypothetical protein [Bifidobacterium moukalabense]